MATIPFEDLRDTAIKSSRELLMLPIIGAQSTLKYFTGHPGVRYKERLVVPSLTAELVPDAPYNHASAQSDFAVNVRELETYLGSHVSKFDPTVAMQTIYGEKAALIGDGQKSAPTAKDVLALTAKQLSNALNRAIWSAKRNANGTTTSALFDGLDTITEKDITAGDISAANGNYLKLTDAITEANADIILKQILFSLDDELRGTEAYVFLSQDLYDKYCEAYQANHNGIAYNTQYSQREVEGSDGLLKFVPLASKKGSKFIHVTPKSNVIYGYDVEGEPTTVQVDRFDPYVLTLSARMFFGVQFASVDPRVFKVIELA